MSKGIKMKGTVLDFSIQTNSGIISGEDQQRYTFIGSEWKEQISPQRGLKVDFDINEKHQAIAVYKDLLTTHSTTPINTETKTEDQYQFMDWFIKCLKNYANFNGRARRKEYWFFRLAVFLLTLAMMIIDTVLETEVIFTGLFTIAMLLPDLAVSVRRLHDTERSGWWFLIALIPIIGFILLMIWFASEGKNQPNLYGEAAK